MDNAISIREALDGCTLPADDVVVIHSSLPDLRPPESISKWDFLRAIQSYVDDGHTIAIPSFTFSSCGGTEFDPIASPSEVGILGDWVSELDGFTRSHHPIYSFQVAGPLSSDILSMENETTFGDSSVFAFFERVNAKIVMLGCDWEFCTLFHRSEEAAAVPYRYYKTFDCYDSGDATMFVRDGEIDATNDFSALVDQLKENDMVSSAPLWGGLVQGAYASDISAAGASLLEKSPYALVSEPEAAKYRASLVRRRETNPPYRIALLGQSNLSLIGEATKSVLQPAMDRTVEIWMPPFGQLGQAIHQDDGPLYNPDQDIVFFVDRFQDLLGSARLVEPSDIPALEERANEYISWIERFRETSSATIVVCRFDAPLGTDALGFANRSLLSDLATAVNAVMDERLAALPDVYVIDLMGDASASATDRRLWAIGRFPFSQAQSEKLGRRFAGLAMAHSGRTCRLIAVDLDNTLWGGVLGEDGRAGLQLGEDYPGNAFVSFQRALKVLSDAGTALCILSKNDENDSLEAIDTLPNMALTTEDFVGHAISWNAKFEGLRHICNDLALSPEHVLFIDDNPVERERMRQELPGVRVLDLPPEPADYVDALMSSPWVARLGDTAEDKMRVSQYKARARLQVAQRESGDMDAFVRSLAVKLYISSLNETTLARATQLVAKTNQFNTTLRRYSAMALQNLDASETSSVFVIGSEDRFSSFENMGVLIAAWDEPEPGDVRVDTYLLSCRVLGKGLETAILQWLAGYAKDRGCRRMIVDMIETDRNQPAQNALPDAGLDKIETAEAWYLDLSGTIARPPEWIDVIDQSAATDDESLTANAV